MRAIQRRIVTDEEMRPVAVQIDYEDWLEIERLVEGREKGGKTDSGRFRELLENTKGTLERGGRAGVPGQAS